MLIFACALDAASTSMRILPGCLHILLLCLHSLTLFHVVSVVIQRAGSYFILCYLYFSGGFLAWFTQLFLHWHGSLLLSTILLFFWFVMSPLSCRIYSVVLRRSQNFEISVRFLVAESKHCKRILFYHYLVYTK